MRYASLLSTWALLAALTFCFISSEKAEDASSIDSSNHKPQKRSVETETGLPWGILEEEDDIPYSSFDDSLYPAKRGGGTLLRYGKREDDRLYPFKRGTLFRYGKREDDSLYPAKRGGGTLLRYGKREDDRLYPFKRGTLFRYGKREDDSFYPAKRGVGTLFRYGKRGDSLYPVKRRGGTLLRYGKRGDDLFRFEPSGPFDVASKRDVGGFHWGESQS